MRLCGLYSYLTMWEDKYGGIYTWKGYDWAAMERLHEKGYLADPKSKNKSVLVTPEGAKRAKELFEQMFGESE